MKRYLWRMFLTPLMVMMIVPVATAAGFVLGIKSAMSASDNIITLVISEQDELAS